MKKLKPNGFVKTPEDWDELTEIVSGSPEAAVAAHMGWNLACKYHNQILADMTNVVAAMLPRLADMTNVVAEMKDVLAEMKEKENAES